MNEQPQNLRNRRRVIGVISGIALIFGGLVAGIAIPLSMAAADPSHGDAGLIYLIIGVPIGFCVALLIVILGIVVIVKATKPQGATGAPEVSAASEASETKRSRKFGWVWGVGLIVLGVVGGLSMISGAGGIPTDGAELILFIFSGGPLAFFWALIFVTLGIVMLVRLRKRNQSRVQSRPRSEAIPAPGTDAD